MIKSTIDVLAPIDVRSIGESNKLQVIGLLPSNSLSEELFHPKKKVFFREKIRTGAFASTLSNKNIPKLLLNHNYNEEFKAEFTEIKETHRGLEFTAIIENDYELKERLIEVKGLSFGFVVDSDLWSKVNGENIREIFSLKELIEISILMNKEPAYSTSRVIIIPEGEEKELNELQKYILWLRREQLKILNETLLELKK